MMLAPITHSAETMGAAYAGDFNAAAADLASYFGFWPVVLAPYGGGRTIAQQAHLVATGQSDTMNSDHAEPKLRAADIDNQRHYRNINSAAFEYILAMHGFHNITNSGLPFPHEPWHFASHKPITATGGLGTSPLPDPWEPKDEDDDMNPLKGNPSYKCQDKDGLNFLYPELRKDGTIGYRILGRAGRGAPEVQDEFNGIQAALGAGPGVVTRARFNELAKRFGALADA